MGTWGDIHGSREIVILWFINSNCNNLKSYTEARTLLLFTPHKPKETMALTSGTPKVHKS